jgi:hypothetical protein
MKDKIKIAVVIAAITPGMLVMVGVVLIWGMYKTYVE